MIETKRCTFLEAWEVASKIPGWLTRYEATHLYKAADALRTIGHEGVIVEIGAYRGRSTTVLAATGFQVVTFDPMVPGEYPSESMSITEEDATLLGQTVSKLGNVTWQRENATAELLWDHIRLLYIDGKHSGDQPYMDWLTFKPRMMRGSRVAFHDYTTRPEVRRAVERGEANGDFKPQGLYGSLYVGVVN